MLHQSQSQKHVYLQKWIHWCFKFQKTIFHEDQQANNIVEGSSTTRAPVVPQKGEFFPLNMQNLKYQIKAANV